MNNIRAIIADDEPLARRRVRQLLSRHGDIVVVAETRNGLETEQAVRRFKPDLVFLDIEMPGLDGFEVIKKIGVKEMPPVIFVTAHDEFAVRAFETHALDYLVKPLQLGRFGEALDRIRERVRSARAHDLSQKLSALLAAREKERAKQSIIVRTSTRELIIDSDEIDWIEADGYYAAIHARNCRHLIRESLDSLTKRLDSSQFIRVHRSAIVNVNRVVEVRHEGSETVLILAKGNKVPVSRRRYQSTRRILRRLEDRPQD